MDGTRLTRDGRAAAVTLQPVACTSRRGFLRQAGVGALALPFARCTPDTPDRSEAGARRGAADGSGQAPDRPNILLVTTDYQSGMDVPAIGHRFLDMPTLDRLSREGATFRRHYSTAPICIPARNTWITGQYPHTHGKWENIGGWVPETSPVLMAELGAHGYQTTAVGKLHLGFPDDEPLGGFDRWVSADRKGNFGAAGQQDDYAAFLAERGLVRDDYLRMGVEAPTPHVYDWPWDESWHIDHYVGARALEIVERGELREPWFFWVSFNGPHNPWDPPARCSAPYKEMDLPLGHTFPGELDTKPTDHTRLRFNYTGDIPRLIDSDYRRRDQIIHAIRAGHYGNLSFIDEQMGRVIGTLERRGDLDDTIVLWTSDHGAHLGDHDLIHKGTHYDLSARVPLVVRHPASIEPGVRDGFSAHVDLMPTILSLAGAPLPEAMEGRDLTALLEDAEASVQEEVFIEVRGNVSIVTDRWKLGLYPHDGEGDLYDTEDDPFELINRFEDGDYADVRAELSERIRDFSPVWPPTFSVVGG
ncbi:MAG: sulfatase-like hydrolase/transferase [Gemmatimonadetes bacterium]|nr:sulfatase-like hydrolase/transferase [Gemmatimonadota bacterium]MYE95443.1 sulfatase-like hydrolase/transferase [Gemmatimonadota bacterium]MYJ12427.1 sulfatase-like hydrolase/transferase [Gemmatimonadota bacterium]